MSAPLPPGDYKPGSQNELLRFSELQDQFNAMYGHVFPDRLLPRTVVVVPSLTLHPEELAKITGYHHYEERMLCLLMLLQLPNTHIIFVTSQPIHTYIIDYYIHLLPGIPGRHARRRLTLLSCHDASPISLTQKILQRPRLLQRIRNAIVSPESSHIACFNTTIHERTLSVQLGLPIFGCDPALCHLGDKSHGREIFRRANIDLPDGYEHLRDEQDIVEGLANLKQKDPSLRRAVIKLNEGFSGEGNAIMPLHDAPTDGSLKRWLKQELPGRIRFEAASETWERYKAKFVEMRGVVEVWLEGEDKCSPSVQCRIDPIGGFSVLSTHDQILGGPSGQVFLGCTFPAVPTYRMDIQHAGERISDVLREEQVLGRFGVDFISTKTPQGEWKHYAIEINLRKGGTTLPFLMLEFLTNGHYDPETGLYLTPTGQPRFYQASDNLQKTDYIGLTPDDLIDILVQQSLYFDSTKQQGVVFHLMGALSQFGKLGMVAIGDSYDTATQLYRETVDAFDREAHAISAQRVLLHQEEPSNP